MTAVKKMSRAAKFTLWMMSIAAVVLLDQYTKQLVVKMLKPIGSYPLWKDVFHLTYAENTGAAFGILKDARWVFMVLSSIAIIGIIIYMIVESGRISAFAGTALAFIAGGGIGNMIDRIKVGYVVDFFDFTLINFAIFNVADSFVTIGAAMMILYLLVTEIKQAKKNGETEIHAGE